jgi:hypothetical protein
MSFILGVVVGLLVGWNFLPQPASIAAMFAKWTGKTPASTPVVTTTTDPVVPPATTTYVEPVQDPYRDPTRL